MYNAPILKKKKIYNKKIYIALILFALVLMMGFSYAFFRYYQEGNNHVAIAGNISMKLTDSGNVGLTGLYPMTDEDGIEKGIKYNFNVSGYNLSDKTIYYGVYINEGDEVTGKTRFKDSDIKLYLTETINNETRVVYGPTTLEDFNRTMIYTSTIDPNISKENAVNISYQLTMWIDEKVLISDTVTSMEGRSVYTQEQYNNSYASVKVEVYGDFVEKGLPIIGYITYDMSSVGITNPTSTPIYSDNTGTVTSEVTSTTLDKFLGWSTTLNGEVIYQPGDSINASDIVNGNVTLYPVMKGEYLVDKITSTLTLTDAADNIDGTRYIRGKSDTLNYVWYSGKLWRIVSVNGDGSIKIVTQFNMTTLSWDTSDDDYLDDYSTSQIRHWLNNEFLPTLVNTDDLLVASTWDYTTYPEETKTKITPTSYVTNEKIGLLTVYDYCNTVDVNTSLNFLDNEVDWITMSYKTKNEDLYYGSGSGGMFDGGAIEGVRPAVNLISNIEVLYGTGAEDDPYVVDDYKGTGVPDELLNNRHSGEYINFDDTLYRIVGIEEINGEKLTKVTMGDYRVNPNILTTIQIGENRSQIDYSTKYGIGLYLQEWYQNDIKTEYKTMIATSEEDGVVWYQGPSGDDYTKSKTGTPVAATIGFGYYGEIFSSHFGYTDQDTWLMTKRYIYTNFYISKHGLLFDSLMLEGTTSQKEAGVRPSFYLRPNVIIKSGTGMPYDPYEISDRAPVCEYVSISQSHFNSNDVPATVEYQFKCTSNFDFVDSEVIISDFEVTGTDVLEINDITKSEIDNGYIYMITVNIKDVDSGSGSLKLKAGSVKNSLGLTNLSVAGTSILVVPSDTAKPVCAFSGPTIGTISTGSETNTSEFSLECTDNRGISIDYEITASDFEFSTDGVVEISNITTSEITGGNKYTIMVNALNDGTTTLTLKSGVVSDMAGNTNDSVTSNSINVATVVADSTPPVCEFSGPADSKIYVMSSPTSTEFYLTCTDESEFSDSDISTTDFTIGTPSLVSPTSDPSAPGPSLSSEPAVTIGSVTKTAITGGYKYTITVNASYAGSAVLTLKTGAISDKYGNSNAEAVSGTINVGMRNMG